MNSSRQKYDFRALVLIGLYGAFLILAGCAETSNSDEISKDKLAQFVTLYDRNFETNSVDDEDKIRDQRLRIESPALDGYWFYVQLNTGASNKLYRQRVANISLSEDGRVVTQKAFRLLSPQDFVDAWDNSEAMSQLSPSDFEPYFDTGCDQVWIQDGQNSWKGYIDPETCKIFSSRRNTDIRIESEGWLGEDMYKTNERGYSMDMEQLWGTAEGEMISLYPAK